MAFIDYYKILEIDKSASEEDIKKAYRKLARKHHPDLNPNSTDAQQKFQEINEANEVLSNAESRKKYDAHGKDWQYADEIEKNKSQQQQRNSQNRSYNGTNDYSDFFENMFGGSARSDRSSAKFRGQDFQAELHIPFKDVFETHQKTITVNNKNIRITIPAGITNDQTIKIKGHGGDGINGGPKGDLIITFKIENDSKFIVDGIDLFSTEEIDLYTALLGGEKIIEIINGKVKFTISAETANGSKIKLKGKGYPKYKQEGVFGDLYITLQVKLPTTLSEREKELFQELSNLRVK